MPLVEDSDSGGFIRNTAFYGGVSLIGKAVVQKTTSNRVKRRVGSNPTPSANVPLAQLEKAYDYES